MGVDTGKRSPSQVDLDLSAAHASEEGGSHVSETKRDAVFGEINGDGPDYRSVSAVEFSRYQADIPDWLDHVGSDHGQDHAWVGCTIDPLRV